MNSNFIFRFIFLATSFTALNLAADHCSGNCGDNKVCGKVDLAAAYVHIDLLDQGKTTDRMDIPAVKCDGCWAFWKGVAIKPTILYGSNDKELFSVGLGLGHITPITPKLTLTPSVGVTYTYLSTTTDLPVTPEYKLEDLSQKFRSYAPYVCLEATYTFIPKWRVCGQVQYAWTRNRTTIEQYVKLKEWSKGWNYAAMLEHDLNDKWSVQLGGASNSSMSKEKRGIRAYGFKLGIARWF